MGGGLMQLVAYGAQDVYLTGNPQITFFKVVYRRHTNFALESIQQTFNGTATLQTGTTQTQPSVTISRNGDLVGACTLQCLVTAGAGGAPTIAEGGLHNMIDSVKCEIGGQQIDKQYGQWLQIWSELTNSKYHQESDQDELATPESVYSKMIGADNGTIAGGGSQNFYVPLQFWFNRNPGLYLPLIALQYHEVKLDFVFNGLGNVYSGNVPTSCVPQLWVDYVYLDTEERRRFAQTSHEYLIEQLQFTGTETITSGASNNVRLNFNHPCKELVWCTPNNTTNPCTFDTMFNALGSAANQQGAVKLQLNGHDRMSERPMSYFTTVQPQYHHSFTPFSSAPAAMPDRVGVYSFALKPEEHQPSGTCNFSRIDNATLVISTAGAAASTTLNVYATNYNVLRVMSGMGGLAYSN